MRHITFCSKSSTFPVAVLLKAQAMRESEIKKHYLRPLMSEGLGIDEFIAFDLKFNPKGKYNASIGKEHVANLMKAFDKVNTQYVLVTESNYFKLLTGAKKAEPHHGYVLPCKMEGYEHINIILSLNYQALFFNKDLKPKLDMSIKTLVDHIKGDHVELGTDIINYSYYPSKVSAISAFLNSLHEFAEITCDVETFSLKHWEAGIGTIGFAWDEHNGGAFLVDYKVLDKPKDGLFGIQTINTEVRELLKEFFETYEGKITFHNAPFDTKVIIYTLWMQDLLDRKGLLEGLHIMHSNIDDTKVISYLATNSAAGNKLSLKDQAHEFAGNYAQDDEDIKDIRRIPPEQLLEYNLVDCLSTWYVKKKNYPKMVNDQQEELYLTLMRPCLKVITQMELTGMCLDMDEVIKADKFLRDKEAQVVKVLNGYYLIADLVLDLREKAWKKDFETRRDKAKNPDKIMPKLKSAFDDVHFNPNSNPQLQSLLYEFMGLPIIDKTKNGAPATGKDTLKTLLNHTTHESQDEVLNSLIEYSEVSKILSSFMGNFLEAPKAKDGMHYLFGCFNLNGTKSGRLSSSDPNLQQLPSGSTYGKLIKACFVSPPGKIFGGADFNALEDVINTLLTKDPNKRKVLLDGFDGHMFRAANYWPEKFPDLDMDDPDAVNALKKPFDKVRSASKPVSFALQYLGTWITLVKNCGFSEAEAKSIEANFHKLYSVSRDWVQGKIRQASKDGYIEMAFGLRLRTPMLGSVLIDSDTAPREAQAEARTVGNAVSGQSYGLVNNRAALEFMERVWASPYAERVSISALIHDAIYPVWDEDLELTKWVNDNLIECMTWQDLPELHDPDIKLGAELDIFFPSWKDDTTLPNYCSTDKIIELCSKD